MLSSFIAEEYKISSLCQWRCLNWNINWINDNDYSHYFWDNIQVFLKLCMSTNTENIGYNTNFPLLVHRLSPFSFVVIKTLSGHNSVVHVFSLADWSSSLLCFLSQCGALSTSELLIVLFIVCLCWLMAQCYVRREERLPQAHAGQSVNPSTQAYWLTEALPQ